MVEKENLSTLGESWGATKIEMRRKMEGRDLREREGDEPLVKDSGAMERERRMGMACAGKEALRRGGGRMGGETEGEA